MTTSHRRAAARRLVALGVLAIVAAGCTGAGGPILANPTPPRPSIAPATPSLPAPTDPIPIVLPRDDGPHDRLTEWWYYTGHLRSGPTAPRTYGFEYVIFRAERGSFPTTWASHLAITDETGDRFVYSQRVGVGDAVDRSPRDAAGQPTGFDLTLSGFDPTDPAAPGGPPWTMRGSAGRDRLTAETSAAEGVAAGMPSGFGLDLSLTARKPPALHDRDGWIDFGPAGGSYYYSRTAMDATGSLTLHGESVPVDGTAWFDHQWGDFISVGGGGWDWFAVNLDDGTDLTLSLVRDADGSYPLVYGTLVEDDGTTRHLGRDAFTVTTTDQWTSPRTGAVYPAGWTVTLPADDLRIDLRPTVADQELDTRATTGVVYWEGSQVVDASRRGRPLGGQAYVELTGYAPTIPATAPTAAPSTPASSPTAAP